MKTTLKILGILLALCFSAACAPLTVSAYEADLAAVALDGDVPDGVHTEVSFSDGTTEDYDAVPDVEEIDGSPARDTIESYEVYIGDAPVLTVGVEETTEDTYRLEFMIPDTEKKVFLVNRTAENVEEIQTKIISGYVAGGSFSIEDLSFIDAEKTLPDGNGDDYLCWAATASNMLTYTGWAAQAGFETEDDVFEAFISHFDDQGGNAFYGFGWFFNGVDTNNQAGDSEFAKVKDYPYSGGYLPDYAYDRLSDSVSVYMNNFTKLQDAMQKLREGCAVGLSVQLSTGGHAVTMWGYAADEAYTPDDAEYYDMLFITDSDSDKNRSGDRREEPNKLDLYRLSCTDSPANLYYQCSGYRCYLSEYIWLLPYSDEPEKETAAKATKDKRTTPDAAINSIYLSADRSDSFDKEFYIGDTVYFKPIIQNVGDQPISGTRRLTVTVTDNNSPKTVYNKSWNLNISLDLLYYSTYSSNAFKIEGLDRGEYTLTIALDPDQENVEAYYYNNTFKTEFTVAPQPGTYYLAGDADGDGEITILDATTVQRMLAGYSNPYGDEAWIRGNLYGEELNILSATAIQRYLAGYSTNTEIDTIKYYQNDTQSEG